jgi:hypothetical protein
MRGSPSGTDSSPHTLNVNQRPGPHQPTDTLCTPAWTPGRFRFRVAPNTDTATCTPIPTEVVARRARRVGHFLPWRAGAVLFCSRQLFERIADHLPKGEARAKRGPHGRCRAWHMDITVVATERPPSSHWRACRTRPANITGPRLCACANT